MDTIVVMRLSDGYIALLPNNDRITVNMQRVADFVQHGEVGGTGAVSVSAFVAGAANGLSQASSL